MLDLADIGEVRADLYTPDDCSRLCYPGLPFVFAEFFLRLAEQIKQPFWQPTCITGNCHPTPFTPTPPG